MTGIYEKDACLTTLMSHLSSPEAPNIEEDIASETFLEYSPRHNPASLSPWVC